MAKDYFVRLKKLAVNNWVPEQPPRPALGYVGFDEVAGDESSLHYDAFLADERDKGKIAIVNQTDWLFSHSGMRIPSQEVFEKSFMDEIMEPILKEGVGFGRY